MGADNLPALREQWEGSLEPVASAQLPGALLVVVKKRLSSVPESQARRVMGKYAYTCLRYFEIREWVVSCDKQRVEAEDAIVWLARQAEIQS